MLSRVNTLCCWHCSRALTRRHHHVIKRVARGSLPDLLPQVLLLQIRYVQMTLQSFSTLMREHNRILSDSGNRVLQADTESRQCWQMTNTFSNYSADHTEQIKSLQSSENVDNEEQDRHDKIHENKSVADNVDLQANDNGNSSTKKIVSLQSHKNISDTPGEQADIHQKGVRKSTNYNVDLQSNENSVEPTMETDSLQRLTELTDNLETSAELTDSLQTSNGPTDNSHTSSEPTDSLHTSTEPTDSLHTSAEPTDSLQTSHDLTDDFQTSSIISIAKDENHEGRHSGRKQQKKKSKKGNKKVDETKESSKESLSTHSEDVKSELAPLEKDPDEPELSQKQLQEIQDKSEGGRSLWLAVPNTEIPESTLRNLHPDILHAKMIKLAGMRFAWLTFNTTAQMKKVYKKLAKMDLQVEYLGDLKISLLTKNSDLHTKVGKLCEKLKFNVSTSDLITEEASIEKQRYGIFKFQSKSDLIDIVKHLKVNEKKQCLSSVHLHECVYKKVDFERTLKLGNFSAEIQPSQLKLLSPDIKEVFIRKTDNASDLRYAYLQFQSIDIAKKNEIELKERGLKVVYAGDITHGFHTNNIKGNIVCVSLHSNNCFGSLYPLIVLEDVIECYVLGFHFSGIQVRAFAFLKFLNNKDAQVNFEALLKKGYWKVDILNQMEKVEYTLLYVDMNASGLSTVDDVKNLCKDVVHAEVQTENGQSYTILCFERENVAVDNYKLLREKSVTVGFVTSSSIKGLNKERWDIPEDFSKDKLFLRNLPENFSSQHLTQMIGIPVEVNIGTIGSYRFAVFRLKKAGCNTVSLFFRLKSLGYDVKPLQAMKIDEGCYMILMKGALDSIKLSEVIEQTTEYWCYTEDRQKQFLFFNSEETTKDVYNKLMKTKGAKNKKVKIFFRSETEQKT